MTTVKVTRLELDHPELSTACAKVVEARGIRTQMEGVEKDEKDIVRAILEEFPGTKEFTLPEHTIVWGENNYSKAETFKRYLIDAGVDPEIIQAATEAAKTKGEPKLLIEKRKL